MAKTGSFIKLDRGLKNNSLWLERPFSKGQAWVDLLLLAQGIEMDKHYRGQIQHMEPGTVYTSILYLTNRWGWSRNKVYRFLETLVKAEMIVIDSQKPTATLGETINRTRNGTYNGTTNGTIISIVKWEVYQYSSTKNDTNDGTPNGTMNRTSNGTHNRKHIKESNKEKANRENRGRSAPKSSSEEQFPCGKSENLKPRDEGTAEDIPEIYRKYYKTYPEYYDARNT